MKQKPKRPHYYVYTWDPDRQEWTPQIGVRCGPYSQFGLRRALRALRQMGYSARQGDPWVRVVNADE